MWGARNRVRTRHIQLVAVLGLSVMAEFACWPAGAPGDSALSTQYMIYIFISKAARMRVYARFSTVRSNLCCYSETAED
jgi:hypothetical protein